MARNRRIVGNAEAEIAQAEILRIAPAAIRHAYAQSAHSISAEVMGGKPIIFLHLSDRDGTACLVAPRSPVLAFPRQDSRRSDLVRFEPRPPRKFHSDLH
jgi:hypothetical protein